MNSKTTDTKLAEALRALVAVIREGYESDDPHGALDRIAEHAEGAAATLAEHDASPAPSLYERRGAMVYGEDRGPGSAPYLATCATAEEAQHMVDALNVKPAPGLAALCHALADALQERRAAGAFRGLYASQRETLAALQDMARFVGDEVEAEPARYGDAPNA